MTVDLVAVSRHLEQTLGVPPLIRCNGKHPLDTDWPTGPRTDPNGWRRRLADHTRNVGMVCGDGLVAVDVDLHHPDGENSFERLRELGLPIETVTQITGGGGRHYLYRVTGPVPCASPLAGFPGVDVRGDGGQIIVSPSVHPDTGRVYEWEHTWGPEDLEPLVLPAALVTLFGARGEINDSRPLDERDERAINLLLEHFHGHHPRVRASWIEVTRPGKDDGASATVGRLGPGAVKVWTSNWSGLPAGVYSLHQLRRLAGVAEPRLKTPTAATTLLRSTGVRTSLQRWVWAERIPLGELTLGAGREKLGKSTAFVWVAARVTRGNLPGDLEGTPRDVVFISAEDHYARVLLPRLDLADVDRSRLWLLNPAGPGFTVDAVRSLDADVGLLVLDPLSVFLDIPAMNEHGENSTRNALLPFVELAQDLEAGLVGVRHFNKGGSRENPFDVVMGSRAYSAAARSVLFFTPDPQHKDRPGGLLFARGNLSAPAGALRYRLDVHDHVLDDGNTARIPVFVLEESAVQIDLEDALGPEEAVTARDEAREWLLDVLAHGPVKTKELQRMADDIGHAWRTVERAKRELPQVTVERVGGGAPGSYVLWQLTVPPGTPPQSNVAECIAVAECIDGEPAGQSGNPRTQSATCHSKEPLTGRWRISRPRGAA